MSRYSLVVDQSADCPQAVSESIPAALLTRARTVASEHKALTEKLSDGFDTRTAKKLGEYSPIVNALGQWDRANEVSMAQRYLAEAAVADAGPVCHRVDFADTRQHH